jgi:hypothetical protein
VTSADPGSALDAAFGAARGIKLAAAGNWEQSLRQPLTDDATDARERREWLEGVGPDVAVEIAFETSAFVGLRLRPEERRRAGELLTGLIRALAPGASKREPARPRVRDVIEAVDRIAEPRFHRATARQLQVGVLDRWQSIGAATVDLPSPVGIRAAILAQPAGRRLLDAACPAPVIVEVAYGPQADGWLGAPASSPYEVQGVVRHQLDAQRIDELAALLCSATTLGAAISRPSGRPRPPRP